MEDGLEGSDNLEMRDRSSCSFLEKDDCALKSVIPSTSSWHCCEEESLHSFMDVAVGKAMHIQILNHLVNWLLVLKNRYY